MVKKIFKVVGRVFAYIFTLVAVLVLTVYLLLVMLCKGDAPATTRTFVPTMLETGALKFVVNLVLTEEEILAYTTSEGSAEVAEDVDTSMIQIGSAVETDDDKTTEEVSLLDALEDPDGDGIIYVPISGHTFGAALLVVRDPSKVSIASIYPFSSAEKDKYGITIEQFVNNTGSIAGINAGEFVVDGTNWGGRPLGVVVSHGEIQFNAPGYGDVMIGFNEDNVLVIKELTGMGADAFAAYVAENHIRDAVTFKDVSDGNNNHFTKLIINGEAVDLGGKGVGANPRTAIGQCADGTVLLLVTDGRGSAGHLGATAQDLIGVMQTYGAVNAANLDGGGSSSLYFDGEYKICTTFLPSAGNSKYLPTAFVVEP
ncbi:MAG: phosphodiester glycosidase family protein [Lachnospiraceae bacterium]|nr:phosphodiester glycosidase family protein [Lachnospiraceae bacterium]